MSTASHPPQTDWTTRWFEDLPDAVVVEAADGGLIAANAAARRAFGHWLHGRDPYTAFGADWPILGEDGLPLPVEERPNWLAIHQGRPILSVVVGLVSPSLSTPTWWAASAVPHWQEPDHQLAGVLTTYHGLSDLKRVETTQQLWSDAFQQSAQGIALQTPATDQILTCNPAFAGLMGKLPTEVAARPLKNLVVPEDHERLQQALATSDRAGHAWLEARLARAPSGPVLVRIDLSTVRDDQGERLYRVIAVHDLVDRQQAERAQQESIELFDQIFEYSPTPMALSHLFDGRIAEANDAFLRLLGQARASVIGRSPAQTGIATGAEEQARQLTALTQKGALPPYEVEIIRPTGEHRIGIVSAGVVPIRGEHYVLSTVIDVTERKQAEQRALQYARLYATLSQVNQAIARAPSPEALYEAICAVAVAEGGFRLAWVGTYLPEHDRLALIASSEPLPFDTLDAHTPPVADSPIGEALRTGRFAQRQSRPGEDNGDPCHVDAAGLTVRSCASVPLRQEGKIIGVLTLYATETGFFGEEPEARLLDALGADISFGLDVLAQEVRRKQAVTDLQESEAALRQSQATAKVGHWSWDTHTNRVTWSDEMYRLFGLESAASSADLDLNAVIARTIHPDDRDKVERANTAVLEDRTPGPLTYRVVWRDGTVHTVWAKPGEALHDETGAITRLIGIVQDVSERETAEARLQEQVRRLRALHTVDQMIMTGGDLRHTLEVLVDQALTHFQLDAAALWVLRPELQTLECAVGQGFRSRVGHAMRLRLGEGFVGRVALERLTLDRVPLGPGDAAGSPWLQEVEGFVGYAALPLSARGRVNGVLEIFDRTRRQTDADRLDFLSILASQAAIAIDNAQLFSDLQHSNVELTLAYDATLAGWSRAMELRDRETSGHSQRVADFTVRLAEAAGVHPAQIPALRRGALLHDIGKLGVPDAILLKPEPLTEEEWALMRQHPLYAHDMLASIDYLRPALDIPAYHHEKWDGSGYPNGLKGEQIPLAARLFAVVDVWDALNSDRPYRRRWSAEVIRAHLQSQSGIHFDPQIVGIFLELLSAEAAQTPSASDEGRDVTAAGLSHTLGPA